MRQRWLCGLFPVNRRQQDGVAGSSLHDGAAQPALQAQQAISCAILPNAPASWSVSARAPCGTHTASPKAGWQQEHSPGAASALPCSRSPGSISNDTLCEELMSKSPYMMTAISLTGGRVHQCARSIAFYGDLRAEAAACGDNAQAGLAMAVLQRLFAVEGEQLLEEMLSAVLGTADPDQESGQGPDAPEPASWAKVLKVPASCQPQAQSAAKAEHPCTSHDVVTVGDAIESRDSGGSSKPSVLQLAVPSAPLPVPERSGCGAGPSQVPLAAHSPGSSLSQAASLGSMPASRLWRQSTGPGSRGVEAALGPGALWRCDRVTQISNDEGSVHGSSPQHVSPNRPSSPVSTQTDVAAAMSPAVHQMPVRVKSLLDLTLVGSRPASTGGAPLPSPGSSRKLSHLSSGARPGTASPASSPIGASADSPIGRADFPRASTGPCSSPEQGSAPGVRQELLDSCPASSTRPVSPPVLHGSGKRLGQRSQTLVGSSSSRLLTICALVNEGRSSSNVARPGTQAEEGAAPSQGNAHRGSTGSVATCGRTNHDGTFMLCPNPGSLRQASPSQAPISVPVSSGLEPGEVAGGVVLMHRTSTVIAMEPLTDEGDSTALSSEPEVAAAAAEACCWHEVFIKCQATQSGSGLLLIYQSDVTLRTQLETTMAKLTELQLNTLCQIFPRHVIEFLSTGGNMALPQNLGHLARSHADVSVLFMDICGFTSMSKQVAPDAVMTFLNSLFSSFDELCEAHRCHKVETAGDCYIVSSGLLSVDAEGFAQVAQDHDPAESTANLFAFAKDMLAASREVLMPHDSSPVQIRIGIHTGPCVSGVVGSKLPKFAVFGDTMNTASRMESTCTPGRIQISAATHSFLLASGCTFPEEWEASGGIAVKGKGVMETYLWREAFAPALSPTAVAPGPLGPQASVLTQQGSSMTAMTEVGTTGTLSEGAAVHLEQLGMYLSNQALGDLPGAGEGVRQERATTGARAEGGAEVRDDGLLRFAPLQPDWSAGSGELLYHVPAGKQQRSSAHSERLTSSRSMLAALHSSVRGGATGGGTYVDPRGGAGTGFQHGTNVAGSSSNSKGGRGAEDRQGTAVGNVNAVMGAMRSVPSTQLVSEALVPLSVTLALEAWRSQSINQTAQSTWPDLGAGMDASAAGLHFSAAEEFEALRQSMAGWRGRGSAPSNQPEPARIKLDLLPALGASGQVGPGPSVKGNLDASSAAVDASGPDMHGGAAAETEPLPLRRQRLREAKEVAAEPQSTADNSASLRLPTHYSHR